LRGSLGPTAPARYGVLARGGEVWKLVEVRVWIRGSSRVAEGPSGGPHTGFGVGHWKYGDFVAEEARWGRGGGVEIGEGLI